MKRFLSALPYGIGQRPQTEQDFFRICDIERIELMWSFISAYCHSPYGSIISLDKRLKGIEMMFVAWHELGHHFRSVGKPFALEFFDVGEGKDETQVDAIALIAICPTSYLDRLHEILDVSPRRAARRIFNERRKLYQTYGI